MSGTSADGVDAALVEWPDGPEARPSGWSRSKRRPSSRRSSSASTGSRRGALPGAEVLRELAALDVALGERFAAAARALARRAGVALERVAAIASHGQTVAHHPELRATLQIGDPSVIAERSGRPVVADFRPRDLAAGGEGAPLAPFFHRAAFATAGEGRVVLNLGGIANVTWLPAGGAPDDVVAFDVGPANTLIDAVVQTASGGAERFDADARARAARPRGRAAPRRAARRRLPAPPAAQVHRPRALRPRRGGGALSRARRAKASRPTI